MADYGEKFPIVFGGLNWPDVQTVRPFLRAPRGTWREAGESLVQAMPPCKNRKKDAQNRKPPFDLLPTRIAICEKVTTLFETCASIRFRRDFGPPFGMRAPPSKAWNSWGLCGAVISSRLHSSWLSWCWLLPAASSRYSPRLRRRMYTFNLEFSPRFRKNPSPIPPSRPTTSPSRSM